MRPRFANRGSTSAGRGRGRLSGSFNEAPIRESGKFNSPVQNRKRVPGFNEAPIRESGKFKRQVTLIPMIGGFNEAPIRESGKYAYM